MEKSKAGEIQVESIEEVKHLAIYERYAAIMRADESRIKGDMSRNQYELGYAEAWTFVLQSIGEE